MGTHPIFESDFDCLTEKKQNEQNLDGSEIGRQKKWTIVYLDILANKKKEIWRILTGDQQ